jgi:S-adenosylmethionine synthetase
MPCTYGTPTCSHVFRLLTSTYSMRLARTCSPGHPDRACDIIAESIIDEYLRRDPLSAIRLQVCGGRGALFVTGVASSSADFDVGAVVSRVAMTLGLRNAIEPFVSIESIPGSFVIEATRTGHPIAVLGYATRESEERVPLTVALSRRIAKKMEDVRHHDGEWFWLDPAFTVVVEERNNRERVAFVSVAHGEQEIKDVRDRISGLISGIDTSLQIRVNEFGPLRSAGLDLDIGSSGISDEAYGSGFPLPSIAIGCDPSNPRKFGNWLARGLACRVLAREEDANAILVQAIYAPGDKLPSELVVRDERGRMLIQDGDAESLSYSHLKSELRPGLSTDASHWGFTAGDEMPWEK